MSHFTGLKAAIFAACIAFVGTSQTLTAGETLSRSNAPVPDISADLAALFAIERNAITDSQSNTVARVLAQYKPRLKPTPPMQIDYTKAFLAELPTAQGDAQWRCLAEALYFEARGESVKGQFAVAEVILNRVDSRAFPSSICGVINQGTGKKYQCQFTYTCDGYAENIREPKAFAQVGKVAKMMIEGGPRRLTSGATHYHTRAVNPRWARVFPRTASIGVHYFYKMPRA